MLRPITCALAFSSLAGCMPAWGEADDLAIVDDGEWDDDAGGTDGGRRPRDGGARPTDGDPSTSDDTSPAPPEPDPDLPLAKGIAIDEVAVFQGVKVSVAKGGTKVGKRNAPVIAGREGLVRVYVTPGSGWSAHEIIGRLVLTDGAGASKVIKATATPSGPSSDGALASTVNFDVPLDAIRPDTSYAVSLHTATADPGAGSTAGARYPATGSEPLEARSTGSAFKVTIVPVKYGADGSHRLPDTSDAQKELYRKAAMAMYPARQVQITFREPYAWSGRISAGGSGFDELLSAMVSLRIADSAPPDVYYYGAFAASSSFDSYCGGGCVTGLCGLSDDPSDSEIRACVGVGFTGNYTAETMVHEVGHASGRYHSPCGGASGTDPDYPYSGAKIGSWGWDVSAKKLVDPKSSYDFMSYCHPVFVSDFTFGELAKRMAFVSGGKSMWAPSKPVAHRLVRVSGDGSMRGGDRVEIASPIFGKPRAVVFEGEDGRTLGASTGHFYPYDHLPGGLLLVPDGPSGTRTLAVRDGVAGSAMRLAVGP